MDGTAEWRASETLTRLAHEQPPSGSGDGVDSGVTTSTTPHSVAGARRRRPPLWLIIPCLVIIGLSLLPVGYLVLRATEGSESAWLMLWRVKTLQVIANSVVLVAAVVSATTLIAVPLAWLTTRTDLPWRRLWATCGALPLVIPSYVGALALVAALGPRGMAQELLAPLGVERLPSLYGFWGSWLALTLFTFPYPFLAARAACQGLDPGLEEAARGLGLTARQTFWRVTVPHLRPAIAAGALLSGLYTLGDFGVVTLLRYDTFTRAIYTSYRAAFDRSLAASLALVLVGLTIVVLVFDTRLRGRTALYRVGNGAARQSRIVPLGRWRAPALLFCAGLTVLSLGLPLTVLGYWLGRQLLGADSPVHLLAASQVSAVLGLATAALAVLAALPVAVLSIRYPGRLGMLVERTAYLGYALPGIVLAIAFVALSVRTPWYQTLGLLIVVCAMRALPQAVGAARLSLGQISPRLEDAARGLGRTLPQALLAVTLPLLRPGLLAGALLVLLTTLKELPISLLLLPVGDRTLPTLIWTAASDARYGEAALPALVLILLTAGPSLWLATRANLATG